MKLSDYIKPMSAVSFRDAIFREEFINKIKSIGNVNLDVSNYIEKVFKDVYNCYSNLGYSFIPIDVDIENFDRVIYKSYFITFFTKLRYLSVILDNDVPMFKDLKPHSIISIVEEDTNSGSNNNTKTYGKKIEKNDRKSEFSMGENSPIDARISSISSPNIKSQYATENEFVDNHSGTDTEGDVYQSSSENNTEKQDKTVENYQKYIDFIERYNLPKLIDDTIRMYIWEFNSVR